MTTVRLAFAIALITTSSLAAHAQTIVNLGSGFNQPYGVAVDSRGNVFVADTFNNAVKEILAEGGYTSVITLASGLFAEFDEPFGVAVDSSGNVFVTNFGNSTVKEILAEGGYNTVNTLGSGFSGPIATCATTSNSTASRCAARGKSTASGSCSPSSTTWRSGRSIEKRREGNGKAARVDRYAHQARVSVTTTRTTSASADDYCDAQRLHMIVAVIVRLRKGVFLQPQRWI